MKKITKLTLGLLILIATFVWASVVRSPYDSNVHIYFFNVGQGDSILIEKGQHQILIDGGPDDKVLQELGKAMPLGDRNIEEVVLTHPHADHLSGINLVLDRYSIGVVYSNAALHTSNGYLEFLNKIRDKKINYKIPEIGDKITPFDNGMITFLWPGKQFEEKTIKNLNNSSEILRFCYFDRCSLLTGDLEIDGQDEMLKKVGQNDLQAELLKLPHHGSKNGTDQRLLDLVKPQYAIVSAGEDNKFGHPHASVLDLLTKNEIKLFRTDRDGTIEFVFSQSGVNKK